MKKWRLIIIAVAVLIILTGCFGKGKKAKETKETSNPTSESIKNQKMYDKVLGEGKQAIVDEDFKKAVVSFELALSYQLPDKVAERFLKQTELYIKAIELIDQNKSDEAKTVLYQVIDMKEGLDTLVVYGKRKLEELIVAREKQENVPVAPQKLVLTESQKEQINSQFLTWATGRAKLGGMAITDIYFSHGAAGYGDWYAESPDGYIQVQNQNLPGYDSFPIHAIGGVVFYYSLDGTVGLDPKIHQSSTAEAYGINTDFSGAASKYILGDNGVVYEMKFQPGEKFSFSTGFSEVADDGTFLSPASRGFIVSEDQAAQTELQRLMSQFK